MISARIYQYPDELCIKTQHHGVTNTRLCRPTAWNISDFTSCPKCKTERWITSGYEIGLIHVPILCVVAATTEALYVFFGGWLGSQRGFPYFKNSTLALIALCMESIRKYHVTPHYRDVRSRLQEPCRELGCKTLSPRPVSYATLSGAGIANTNRKMRSQVSNPWERMLSSAMTETFIAVLLSTDNVNFSPDQNA